MNIFEMLAASEEAEVLSSEGGLCMAGQNSELRTAVSSLFTALLSRWSPRVVQPTRVEYSAKSPVENQRVMSW